MVKNSFQGQKDSLASKVFVLHAFDLGLITSTLPLWSPQHGQE